MSAPLKGLLLAGGHSRRMQRDKATIAYEILRQIRRERMNLPGYVIIVNAHPAVVDLLKNDERVAVTEAEIVAAMRFAFETLKLVIEPGGAVALAAALAGKVSLAGTVLLVSGGNVDPATFRTLTA